MDDPKASSHAEPDLVPVATDRHAGRRWRRFTSYDFIHRRRLVPIVLSEHEQVAATLPFLFMQTAIGPWPVALTRLAAEGQCAVVAPNGAWLGSYIPSILRVHPFSAQSAGAHQLALLVDEGSGLVTDDPQDEPFFDADGSLAPALQQVVDFFRKRAAAEGRTREAMRAIASRNLLRLYQPPEGLSMAAEGLMTADTDRLAALGRVDLAALHRCGALALLIVQGVSLHHLAFLSHVEARARAAPAPQAAAPAAPETATQQREEALSGFFDALADAQESDLPEVLAPFASAEQQEDLPQAEEKSGDTGKKNTWRD